MEMHCNLAVMSTAIAANISEIPASRVRLLAGVAISDHKNDLESIQSELLCGHSVQVSAESSWGVQCLKKKKCINP
jgi:hypothetical protein